MIYRIWIRFRQWLRYGSLPRPGLNDLYRLPNGKIRPEVDRA